jgi:TonB family protein
MPIIPPTPVSTPPHRIADAGGDAARWLRSVWGYPKAKISTMRRALLVIFLHLSILTAAFSQEPGKGKYLAVIQQAQQVDKQAMYPGGQKGVDKYVQRNLKYPAEAYQQKIQGQVKVKFTVGVDGYVNKVEFLQSDHALFEQEAERLFKGMGKWIPAYVGKKPVEVAYEYPLSFKQV